MLALALASQCEVAVVEDVHAALAHIGFDDAAFRERDGGFFTAASTR